MWILHLHSYTHNDNTTPKASTVQSEWYRFLGLHASLTNTLSKPLTIDCLIFVPCTNLPVIGDGPTRTLQRPFYVVLTGFDCFVMKMLRIIVTLVYRRTTMIIIILWTVTTFIAFFSSCFFLYSIYENGISWLCTICWIVYISRLFRLIIS